MTVEKKTRGGAREGAGRKAKYEKTIVMRVPEIYRNVIKELISQLDSASHIDKHYPKGVTSEPLFLRSLGGKAQQVKFTIQPAAGED